MNCKAVSKFPGLGPKSAKRIILLINNKDIIKPTINALVDVYKNISRCNCGALKSSKKECNNCDNSKINFRKSVLLKILQINGVSVQTFLMDTFIF